MRYITCSVVSALVFWMLLPAGSYSESLIAISCDPTAPFPDQCVFYKVNLTTGDVREVYKPDRAVVRIEVHPRFRDFAIWQPNRGTDRPGETVTIMNAESLSIRRSLGLSEEEAGKRSFWYDDPTSGPQLSISHGKGSPLVRLTPPGGSGPKEVPPEIALDKALLAGASYHTLSLGQPKSLFVSRDGEKGLILKLDESKTRLALSDAAAAVLGGVKTRNLFAPCMDDRTIIVGSSVELDEKRGVLYLVYDRKSDSWWHFQGKGDGSVVQMFQDWIVVQEMVRPPTPTEGIITGEFTFCSRDGKRSFSWMATTDPRLKQGTEILAVWGNEIILRRYSNLFRAEISGEKVVNEKMILDGSRLDYVMYYPIFYVHWVLRCPD